MVNIIIVRMTLHKPKNIKKRPLNLILLLYRRISALLSLSIDMIISLRGNKTKSKMRNF